MFKKKDSRKAYEEEIAEESVHTEVQTDECDSIIGAGDLDMGTAGQEELKPKKKKLPGWAIIPIFAVVALIFFVASKFSSTSGKPTELAVIEVEKGNIKEVYNTSGTVESEKTKVFYSPVNAPVQAFNAKVGQAVKEGDLLVSFDVTNLDRDNQQSQLNVLSTKYTNQDAAQQSSRAAESAAQAKAQAASSVQGVKDQIAQKEAEISQLEQAAQSAAGEAQANSAKAAQLQQKYQQNQDDQTRKKADKANKELELQGNKEGTPEYNALVDEIKQLTTEIGELEVEGRSLEQQISQIGSVDASGTAQALAAARQELDGLKSSLSQMENSGTVTADTGLTGAQVKNMQVSENLAELSALSTEELLAKGREGIKAEFDGIISDVQSAEGSEAVQGGQLFTIASNKDVVVKLEVSANDFDSLSEGNTAQIKIGKKTYQGTLTSIDKIALPNDKGNSVIGARVHIDNPDDDIYIGVSAKVSMTSAEKKDVLCLPNEVVNTSTDGDFVYIIQNGTVKKQMVELGVASSSKVEIESGLKAGDQVIADVSGELKEGMKATGVLKDSQTSKGE